MQIVLGEKSMEEMQVYPPIAHTCVVFVPFRTSVFQSQLECSGFSLDGINSSSFIVLDEAFLSQLLI